MQPKLSSGNVITKHNNLANTQHNTELINKSTKPTQSALLFMIEATQI